MSDCFDHHLDAFESMDQDYDYCGKGATDTNCHFRRKKKSAWITTEIEAKEIDGRAHIYHQGEWLQLKVPTFVKGDKLAVKREFWESRQHFMTNHVKDYYDNAGALKWERTNIKGTVMGDTKYAWNGEDYVPLDFPTWIDPETNLISVPVNFKGYLIKAIN